jgi:CBS domain-containing protein
LQMHDRCRERRVPTALAGNPPSRCGVELGATREKAMRVSEAMTRDVCTVRPDQTVEQAARLMAKVDVGLLPVGEDDRLVGVITDRDIALRAVGEGNGSATEVRQVMSPDVKYCFEDEDTAHVARNMAEQQVRRLPVVSRHKRLVGILSLADMVQHEAGVRVVGSAYRGIAEPGGVHSQTAGDH